MALVGCAESATRDAEGLARAGAGPDRSVVWPGGEAEGVGPDSDPREEVTLGEPPEVGWSDVIYAPLVDFAGSDVAGGDQVAQPLGGEGIDLVVVGPQLASFGYVAVAVAGARDSFVFPHFRFVLHASQAKMQSHPRSSPRVFFLASLLLEAWGVAVRHVSQ